MAGLDSINSGQKSGGGYHPGLDDKPFDPKTSKPSVDAPTYESGQGGGQGDREASGLPGTPYKAKKPNPEDGGGHRPGYGDKWKQAFDERFGNDGSGQTGSKQSGGQGKDLKQLRQTARNGTTQEKVAAIKDVGKSVVTALEHAKGNPRAAVGELADQYLHVGQKLGDAMWLAWMVVFVAGTIASFVILGGGIPGLIVLNIMLVSPQTAYRLTEFILDFFAVGEVLQTADAIGLTNVKVTIRGWQKAIIVLLDIIALLFTLFMTVIIITSFCYFIKTPDLFFSYAKLAPTDAIGAAVDTYFGYPIFETCGKFTDFAGGVVSNVTGNNGTTPPGGPIVASGCSTTESGGCTRNTINACPGMAAQMENSIRACNQESAGGQVAIASGTDKCQLPSGEYVSFSIGLWQINMLDSTQPEFPECKDALILTGRDPSRCVTRDKSGKCIVTYRSCKFGPNGQAGYQACKTALSDPVRNTKQACTLFNDRQWRPWPHTRKVCALP